MNEIFILKEIGKWDSAIWKLFSMLNKECYECFCVNNIEYEILFRKIEKDEFGTYYKLDGLLHRSNGPAVLYNGGSEEWYFKGKLHRLDGPAVIIINYCINWYVNGKLHRLNGPAIEFIEENNKECNSSYIDGRLIST